MGCAWRDNPAPVLGGVRWQTKGFLPYLPRSDPTQDCCSIVRRSPDDVEIFWHPVGRPVHDCGGRLVHYGYRLKPQQRRCARFPRRRENRKDYNHSLQNGKNIYGDTLKIIGTYYNPFPSDSYLICIYFHHLTTNKTCHIVVQYVGKIGRTFYRGPPNT